jgi:hypothetical protein
MKIVLGCLLILLLGAVVPGIDLCQAQQGGGRDPANQEQVILTGTVDMKIEDAQEGQDYIARPDGPRGLDGRALLYDPRLGRYMVRRFLVAATEVVNNHNQPVTSMTGRVIEIVPPKSDATLQNASGRKLRLSGSLQCGRLLYLSSFEEIQYDPATDLLSGCRILSCTYHLSQGSINLPGAGPFETTITAKGTGREECLDPVVSDTPPWVKVEVLSWEKNAGRFRIKIDANTSAAGRVAEFMIDVQKFSVSQAGLPCSLSPLPPGQASFPASGGKGTISLRASSPECGWTVSTSSGWISPFVAGGCGNAAISYLIEENRTGFRRDGSLAVRPFGKSDLSGLQPGKAPELAVTQAAD